LKNLKPNKNRKMGHGEDGVVKLASLLSKDALVLDIGCGPEETHANYMRSKGITVQGLDVISGSDYQGKYEDIKFDYKKFDGILASHVLEHQLNVNSFLRKINNDLKEGGWLCLTVPPLKPTIVSGHVSFWNAGLMLYNLVLAGFDCSNAKIKTYDYNISIVLQKKSFDVEKEKLYYDWPDLVTLNKYFPKGLKYNSQNRSFDGNIKSHNW